jgi:hypothetical protein
MDSFVNMTYNEAVQLILAKINGDEVDETQLDTALMSHPEIMNKLRASFTNPPEWAKEGLKQMVRLKENNQNAK